MTEQSMIERGARAICAAYGLDPDAPSKKAADAGHQITEWLFFAPAARAVIEEMREPTEAMVEAFYEESYKTHPEDRFDVDTFPKLYGALIDKALA